MKHYLANYYISCNLKRENKIYVINFFQSK